MFRRTAPVGAAICRPRVDQEIDPYKARQLSIWRPRKAATVWTSFCSISVRG